METVTELRVEVKANHYQAQWKERMRVSKKVPKDHHLDKSFYFLQFNQWKLEKEPIPDTELCFSYQEYTPD